MSDYPFRQIWLSPHCDKCWREAEMTWCQDNVYDPCEDCGKKALRYALDRRQLPRAKKEE